MHYQDLGDHTTEPGTAAAARDSPAPAGATAAGAAAEDDDAIPLSDLSPPKRTPEPSLAHAHDDHDDGRSSISSAAAPGSGRKRPPIRAHTPHHDDHDHHHHHHRRQSAASVSVSDEAAARGGMSMAFCAAYPFRRLVFQTLGKDRVFQLLYFLSGPLLFGMTLAIGAHTNADRKMACTVATTLLMVVWYLFECLPMGVVSFLPVVLFPLLGVVPGSRIAMVYFSDQVLILFGSCMIAAAVEEYKLHRRLALAILSRAGRSPYRLVLGFLGATFFLSMWLSNTATAAMMAPLASAVMDTLSAGHGAAGGGGGQRQQEEERDARWRLLSSSLSAAGGGPQQEEDEEEEEDYEEEIDIELPTMGAGTRRPALSSAPQRSFSLDERRGPIGGGRGGVSGAGGAQEGEVGEGEEEEEEQWRRRLRTEDPGALRKREQDGEGGMVEIHLWGLPQEGTGDGAVGGADEEEEEEESADAFWCGIRKSEIEFSISVAICYGASLGGMATLTGTSTNLVLNGVLGANWTGAVPISFGAFLIIAGPIAFTSLVAFWVYLCWKMRMESLSPRSLLRRADWRDYLCIALHNLTPRGYQPPHAPLASQDGNNPNPARRGGQRGEEEEEEEERGQGGGGDENGFSREYAKLPPMLWEEKVIVADFVVIALLWFFRDPKGYPGWTSLLPEPAYVTDGTIALLGALALFVIPRQDFFRPQPPQPTQQRAAPAAAPAHARLRTQEEDDDEDGDGDHNHAASSTAMHHARSGLRSRANSAASSITRRSTAAGAAASGSSNNAAPEPFGVLPWELVLQRMPWDVLFLVGSGLALSLAFKESKLSRMIATDLSGVADVPFPFVVFSVIVVVILISNFISNVACANIVLPPLGCIAVHLGRHPLALMLPATLAGSFAFISPIATPANAIAFSLGTLTASELARVGSVLTVMSLCVLLALFPPLFGALIDADHVPTWAFAGC